MRRKKQSLELSNPQRKQLNLFSSGGESSQEDLSV